MPVTVTRTGNLAEPSAVNYATADGTAHAETDYTAVSGTLSFAAGESSKTVSIVIRNDNVFEPTEFFTLNLSNAIGNNTFLVSPSSATITISDNDQRPRISETNISVNETGGGNTSIASVSVTLSNPSTETINVDYSTANGTAVSGSDYVATSGTLTFNPLETTKTVPVTIIGDNQLEGNESFTLNLINPINSSILSGTATITIVDFVLAHGTAFDFDGDHKADLSIFRPTVGEWYYQRSTNGVTNGVTFGVGTDKIMPADYTGDGRADIAFWRPSTGEWFVLRSEDSTFYAFPFGSSGDIPAPADYDGDGKADAAVYRSSAATWFILRSTGGVSSVPFGISTDIPVPADYDGDGKADVGIYRPGPGQWWNLRSSNGSVFAATFGSSTDKPVPGDYTGDGKADVAFYRPSEGSWYVLRSEDFSFFAFPFGNSTDKPAPADFDGDGKFDAAVFRPSDTNWYILKSTGGVFIQQFGAANDIPLPGAFVP